MKKFIFAMLVALLIPALVPAQLVAVHVEKIVSCTDLIVSKVRADSSGKLFRADTSTMVVCIKNLAPIKGYSEQGKQQLNKLLGQVVFLDTLDGVKKRHVHGRLYSSQSSEDISFMIVKNGWAKPKLEPGTTKDYWRELMGLNKYAKFTQKGAYALVNG